MSESVYSLITALCEKFSDNNPEKTRKLRTKCYEVLLGKRPIKTPKFYRHLSHCDPWVILLAWQCTLTHDHGMPDHALELKETAENALKLYDGEPQNFDNILKFLLLLRKVPKLINDLSDIPTFKMPETSLQLFKSSNSEDLKAQPPESESENEEETQSIWEIAMKSNVTHRKTWENLNEYGGADKEKPFITELGDKAYLWVDNLPSVQLRKKPNSFEDKLIPMSTFIKSLKYLMVGLSSDAFEQTPNNQLKLKENVNLNGIRPYTLENYSAEIIETANRYIELKMITNKNLQNHQKGFIYEEFRRNLSYYLDYYLILTMHIPENIGLIEFKLRTAGLRQQIRVLRSICRLDSAENPDDVRHGSGLLDHLCMSFRNYLDKDIIPIFAYLFHGCGQVYFTRFLHKWMVDGAIDDQYGEFFIKTNRKHVNNKNRSYWLHAFHIVEDLLPNFLMDYKMDILNCGRIMNLLKICFPDSKICKYLLLNEPSIIACCITEKQLQILEKNVEHYMLQMQLECGCNLNLEKYLDESMDDESLLLIKKKRDVTLERLELAKQVCLMKNREKKLKDMEDIKLQYDLMVRDKNVNELEKIEMDLMMAEKNLAIANLKDRLAEKECQDLVEYYTKLEEKTENKRKKIEKQITILQKMNTVESPETVTITNLHSSESMDVINANIEINEENGNELTVLPDNNEYKHQITEKILVKILNEPKINDNEMTDLEKNRNKVMTSQIIFEPERVNQPEPMSIDSTPLSECDQPIIRMANTTIDTPTTTCNQSIDESLNASTNEQSIQTNNKPLYSERMTREDLKNFDPHFIYHILKRSVFIPLNIQCKLLNMELIKRFVIDLNYLEHLQNLRMYYFLQDGEFALNVTENLFDTLYKASRPTDLINCRTLQTLITNALNNSNRTKNHSDHLSFKINNIPECFDLVDPNVLNCLSLYYPIKWPLNILLPSDAIGKYDKIFRFLLKVNRISWVLKQIYWDMKIFARETGRKEIYLSLAPHYRRIHQCRYNMLHFIQTLQTYIVGHVFQNSWILFKKNLANVTNLDELYQIHTDYVKTTLLLCFLDPQSGLIRKILDEIFTVILKFFIYFRSGCWSNPDGIYIHSNYHKLVQIYENFEKFIIYFIKTCYKIVQKYYKPHLMEFMDLLHINDYFSSKIAK